MIANNINIIQVSAPSTLSAPSTVTNPRELTTSCKQLMRGYLAIFNASNNHNNYTEIESS